jgi:MFS family permease
MAVTRTIGERPDVPLRTQGAIYSAGLFSNSMTDVASVVLPLWLASMGLSTLIIGLVVGARHILPLLFAIHGGSLIDRLGTRRVMIASAAVSAVVLPLFPVFPWVPVIMALQMANGLATTMCWMVAQASFGRVLLGHPDFAGPFAFSLRMGSFIGPPLAGFAFDLDGVLGGFGILTLWAIGMLASGLALPRADDPTLPRKIAVADLMPRVADYRAALALVFAPAMALVLTISVFRIAASSMQDSFYAVFLNSIGMSGTQIGLLITLSSAVAAASALAVGWFSRRVSPLWLLILNSIGSIVFISITPLFTSFAMLGLIAVLRGFCMGLSQPLMLSLLVSAAERESQGLGVALRTTANRVAAAVTPMTMGLAAALLGLATSFLVVGGLLLAGMLVIVEHVRRHPEKAVA